MSRSYRFALHPRWVALHVLCVALVVTMVLLGRWQLDVSNSKHFDLQNFGYAIQWWAFSLFVVWMWQKLLRDHHRAAEEKAARTEASAEPAAAASEPVAYRRYVMPTVRESPGEADPTLAAYNDYLARLAAEDRTSEGRNA